MAQLIKIQDYISRYESDIYRYSSQYIRLKKQRWDSIKSSRIYGKSFGSPSLESMDEAPIQFDDDWLEEDRPSIFKSIKNFFVRQNKHIDEDEEEYIQDDQYYMDASLTQEDIKHHFLDELLRFQLRWASSTLRDRSYIDKEYYHDQTLSFLLQQFPDNYLILYKPIFMVKNAPVEAEIIMLSPTATWCVSFIEGKNTNVFRPEKGRYWLEGYGDEEIRHINPLISINRMHRIIDSIYRKNEIDLPIKKAVICNNGFIEYTTPPVQTEYIDRRNYADWYKRMRKNPSPIKFVQLKGAQAILSYCQSTYVRRLEWEKDEEEDQSF